MLAVGGSTLVHTEFRPVFLPTYGKAAKEGDLGCGCDVPRWQKPSRLSEANVVTWLKEDRFPGYIIPWGFELNLLPT